MTPKALFGEDFLRSLFDAFPSPVLVVDRDMLIYDANRAARQLAGGQAEDILRRLCGDVFHCIHALEAPEGCGTTRLCPDCVLRQTAEAVSAGLRSFRRTSKLTHERNGKLSEAWFLVTGHPLSYGGKDLVVLALEEVTELVELRRIVPICSHCRKVRDDADFWLEVEDYFLRHTGLQFSHGICPECLRENYPDFAPAQPNPPPGPNP